MSYKRVLSLQIEITHLKEILKQASKLKKISVEILMSFKSKMDLESCYITTTIIMKDNGGMVVNLEKVY